MLYYGKSLELSRRYEVEADGVLRDRDAWFKNRVYAAAAGVLCYRRIELVSGEEGLPAAWAWAWAAALEKAQLLSFDFPLNTMLNGGHWSPEELAGWLGDAGSPEHAARLAARLGGGAPAQRAPLPAVPPEEADAIDDWSSGDEEDPEWTEDTARQLAMQRGRSRGGQICMASMPREAKAHGGQRGAAKQPREAKVLGGQRGQAALQAKPAMERQAIAQKVWATRRAKEEEAAAAAAKVAGEAGGPSWGPRSWRSWHSRWPWSAWRPRRPRRAFSAQTDGRTARPAWPLCRRSPSSAAQPTSRGRPSSAAARPAWPS